MCKVCDKAIAISEWWEPFVPLSHETPKGYLKRASHFDDYGVQFVMMQMNSASDLVTVGESFKILAVRHVYEPGMYAVQVVRDVAFLAYSQKFLDMAEMGK